jgi:hypothetical protein
MLMEMADGGVVVTPVVLTKKDKVTSPSPRVCNAMQTYQIFSGAATPRFCVLCVCIASFSQVQFILITTNDRAARRLLGHYYHQLLGGTTTTIATINQHHDHCTHEESTYQICSKGVIDSGRVHSGSITR